MQSGAPLLLEGVEEREGCFHLPPQPQKRGGNTDTTIQSRREQLSRVSRLVNAFSSRHPMATNTMVERSSSYRNVACGCLENPMAIYRLWLNPFWVKSGETSKTACWVSTVGPIFLQSRSSSSEPGAVFSSRLPLKESCSNLVLKERVGSSSDRII